MREPLTEEYLQALRHQMASPTSEPYATGKVLQLLDELERWRDYMREIKRHLDAIECPGEMGWGDLEHLGETREIVARALCQHAPHQVFDAQARTFRICTKCGAVLDDLALR